MHRAVQGTEEMQAEADAGCRSRQDVRQSDGAQEMQIPSRSVSKRRRYCNDKHDRTGKDRLRRRERDSMRKRNEDDSHS